MKKLTAIHRMDHKESLKDITREYKTKSAFTEDLRGSGIRVIAVLTEEDINKYKAMSETEAIYKRGQATLIREYCLQVL